MKTLYYLTLALISFSSSRAQEYVPATAEANVIEESKNYENKRSGCLIWNEDSPLRQDLKDALNQWKQELNQYNTKLRQKKEFTPDVRTLFKDDYSNIEEVCQQYADPPPNIATTNSLPAASSISDPKTVEYKQSLRGRNLGIAANLRQEYFHGSQQLSYLPKYGYMEPLLPPLRHPDMCPRSSPDSNMHISDMSYLIEDFGHICRNVIKKDKRTVFVDMGAAYNYDPNKIDTVSPGVREIEKYRRNGIHFDHIYAYEVKQVSTNLVYSSIPEHMRNPLHWMNEGVSADLRKKNNPWSMLKENFDKDDFVVVKLDVDKMIVELPLVHQLLQDKEVQEIVDIFYFEHHVEMDEMAKFWGGSMKRSINYSLQLFERLREAGVAAHYWI